MAYLSILPELIKGWPEHQCLFGKVESAGLWVRMARGFGFLPFLNMQPTPFHPNCFTEIIK